MAPKYPLNVGVFALSLGVSAGLASQASAAPPQVQRPAGDPSADNEGQTALARLGAPSVALDTPDAPDAPPVIQPAAGISAVALGSFMAGRFEQVELCAARARASNPAVAGRVSLAMGVGADGRVTRAKVTHSDPNDSTLHECLEATARTWVLPAPAGGPTDISFTFSFQPAKGPAANGWRSGGQKVSAVEQYPAAPPLGERAAPVVRLEPGRRAIFYGWSLFLPGYIGAALAGPVISGNFDSLVPVFGPFIALRHGGLSRIVVPLGVLQIAGASLMTFGYVRRSRYRKQKRLGDTAWTRHRMGAGVAADKQRAALQFRMRF